MTESKNRYVKVVFSRNVCIKDGQATQNDDGSMGSTPCHWNAIDDSNDEDDDICDDGDVIEDEGRRETAIVRL